MAVMGKVVSRLNHPVELSYNGEALMIPPKGQGKGLDKEKLGSLPNGVVFVQDK